MNRALAHAHVGDFEAAAADAVDAEQRCRELGELTLAAHALHNRGWIAAGAGDLAEGWRLMHDAASEPSWTAPPGRARRPSRVGARRRFAVRGGRPRRRGVGRCNAWSVTITGRPRRRCSEPGSHSTSATRDRALELTATSAAALAAQGRLSLCGAAAGIEIAARREVVEQLGDAERCPRRASHDRRHVRRARERRGAFMAIGPPRRPDRRRRDRPARGTQRGGRAPVPARRARPQRLDSIATSIITSRQRLRTVRRPARSTTVASRRRGRSTRPGVRCGRCTS